VLSKPERFAGAIPFAGGLLLGLDPKAAASKKDCPPFAILHGEADPVVDPSLSDWAYEVFLKADYPCVRYVHLKEHNHWWPGPPVGERSVVHDTIAWMFEVTEADPEKLLASAAAFLEADRGGDALHCVLRAKAQRADAGRVNELEEKIAAGAAIHLATWSEKLKDKDGAWADECYALRERWRTVPELSPVFEQLDRLRKKHVPPAAKFSRKAWKHAGKDEKDEARALFEETVAECFTAFEYVRPARRWLAQNR
jgi:hypothetical protein